MVDYNLTWATNQELGMSNNIRQALSVLSTCFAASFNPRLNEEDYLRDRSLPKHPDFSGGHCSERAFLKVSKLFQQPKE
jgi:hypothetical protein